MGATVVEDLFSEKLLQYGAIGAILAYAVYQDIQQRKRQVAKDKNEATRAINQQDDCVQQLRELEKVRVKELKECLEKLIRAQESSNEIARRSNELHEQVIDLLEEINDETRTFHNKSKGKPDDA